MNRPVPVAADQSQTRKLEALRARFTQLRDAGISNGTDIRHCEVEANSATSDSAEKFGTANTDELSRLSTEAHDENAQILSTFEAQIVAAETALRQIDAEYPQAR